jgi:hypothetical protein
MTPRSERIGSRSLWRAPAVLLAAGLLAGPALVAQGQSPAGAPLPAQTPAPAPAPGDAASQQRPTFRVAVDLVTTDVIVRDDKGQFLADLTKGDFEVLEDGVKQDIASLVLIHGGRLFNQELPPPAPPQEGIILPPSRPTADAAGRIFISSFSSSTISTWISRTHRASKS